MQLEGVAFLLIGSWFAVELDPRVSFIELAKSMLAMLCSRVRCRSNVMFSFTNRGKLCS